MTSIIVVALVLLIICILPVVIKGDAQPSKQSESPKVAPTSPPAVERVPDNVALSALLPTQFVILDLETTGLDPSRDEIIEFGAIKVSLNSDTHPFFQTLVRPSRKLPRQMTAITGISQQMVDADGMELKDALNKFIGFVGDLPIVTYNAEFDMSFIHNAAKACGVIVNNKYTCALKRARRAWPGLPSYQLAYLSDLMSLSDGDQHRALADCQRTVTVFLTSTLKLNQKVRWTRANLA